VPYTLTLWSQRGARPKRAAAPAPCCCCARSELLNAVAPDSVDVRAVNVPPPAAAPARPPPVGDANAGAAAAPPERPTAAPDDGAPAGAASACAERDAGGGGAAPCAREGAQTLGRAEALQNCALALSAARAAGCGLADVAAADVADGAAPAARAVLWQLIRLGVVQARGGPPRRAPIPGPCMWPVRACGRLRT